MTLKVRLLTSRQVREKKRELALLREQIVRDKFRRTIQREVRGLPSMWEVP